MDIHGEARARMVDEQIAARGVTDARVLEAMRHVPREAFVRAGDVERAFDDRALPLDHGQTISQPYMVAVMSQALRAAPGARVLEVGTGSGYQAAVLAEMGIEVISIERHAALAEVARQRLARLGYARVRVVVGDGSAGYPDLAPYDGIVVTAGAPAVPAALVQQLAAGGRLVIPVGPRHLQYLTVVTRTPEGVVEQVHDACTFVPLVGASGWDE